jgi:hypothetical protein
MSAILVKSRLSMIGILQGGGGNKTRPVHMEKVNINQKNRRQGGKRLVGRTVVLNFRKRLK